MQRRVVITGMGTVNPLACQVEDFWRALCAGRSGISQIEQIDTSAFKVKFGGEVKNFKPEVKRIIGTPEKFFFERAGVEMNAEEISSEILKSLIQDILRKYPKFDTIELCT